MQALRWDGIGKSPDGPHPLRDGCGTAWFEKIKISATINMTRRIEEEKGRY
jgi:hypothetical protein